MLEDAGDDVFFPCPCCRYRTLTDRGGFEMCPICWWEDDGQDEEDANIVRGGPNGDLSLREARRNFRLTGTSDALFRKSVRKPTPFETEEFLVDCLRFVVHEMSAQNQIGKDWGEEALSFPDTMEQLREWIGVDEWGLAYDSMEGLLEAYDFKISGQAAMRFLEAGLILRSNGRLPVSRCDG